MLENCLYFCQELKLILNTMVIQMANGSAKPENIAFKKKNARRRKNKKGFLNPRYYEFPQDSIFYEKSRHKRVLLTSWVIFLSSLVSFYIFHYDL